MAKGGYSSFYRKESGDFKVSKMQERVSSLASKLKQLWWLMLIFAICNVAIAVLLYKGGIKEAEPVLPIPAKDVYSIGILQADDLPEQDKMLEGVLASLEAGGYHDGKNIKIDIIKGEGNEKKLSNGAKKFARNKKDLLIAIGSPSAKAAAEATKTIPVVGVGVLYFQKNEAYEDFDNFTGISDYPQVVTQVRMASRFMKLDPLGIVYNPKDESSMRQVKVLRAVAEQKALTLVEAPYEENKLAKPVFEKLVSKVKAVYAPEDPLVLSHFDELVEIANTAQVPIIGEQSEMVSRGAVISISPSYYRMGFSGGRIACKLLAGQVTPKEIPVTKQQDPDLVLNMKQMNALNIPCPGDLWQRARKLYLYDGLPARP